MAPFPARTKSGFQCPPVLRGEALADVRTLAVHELVLSGRQAASRRRGLLILVEGSLA